MIITKLIHFIHIQHSINFVRVKSTLLLHRIMKHLIIFLLSVLFLSNANAQDTVLSIKKAEKIALENYGTIKARVNEVKSAQSLVIDPIMVWRWLHRVRLWVIKTGTRLLDRCM
jgi:adhesin transport system outer membrane protein